MLLILIGAILVTIAGAVFFRNDPDKSPESLLVVQTLTDLGLILFVVGVSRLIFVH